jgi:calcium-dependent protein kinase
MDIILGTPIYMAPELVLSTTYDCRVDVWSLGVITYLLLTGKLPFDGENTDEIKEEILNKELSFGGSLFCQISTQATDFIKECLNRDSEERPYINELF